MGAILSILLWVLTNIPSIISVVREIIALIGKLPHGQRAQAMVDLKAAYQKAHQNGDPQPLKDLHDKLCNDVACASAEQ